MKRYLSIIVGLCLIGMIAFVCFTGKKEENDLRKIRVAEVTHSPFYTPFYVYQYATGLSIAISIATRIYNGDAEMKDKYLEFLKSGSNDYPTNLVSKMGINISESVNSALNTFNDLIEKYK